MSADGRRVRRRRWPWLLLPLPGVLALAAWAVPIARVGDLRVEQVRVLGPGEPDGSSKPAGLTTPRRIAVTFSTPRDLAQVRQAKDFGSIHAVLSDCADDDLSEREVIIQRAGYFGEYGRVVRLPEPAGAPNDRARYRAVFDDRLGKIDDHQLRDVRAIGTPGGLCFSLSGGGGMWPGLLWADRVPLKLDAR